MLRRRSDSSVRPYVVLAILVGPIITVLSSRAFAEEPSPAEMRFLLIETEVALQSDWQVGRYDLRVEYQKGAITLSGDVPDEATRARAGRTAQDALQGYTIELVNKIRVKAEDGASTPTKEAIPTPLDQEQIDKLSELLAAEFPELAERISVNFELQPMPAVVLDGLIPSYEQKLEIGRFARLTFRTLPVVNNLQVRRHRLDEKTVYAVNPAEPDSIVVERDEAQTNVTKRPLPPSDVELAEQLALVLKDDPVLKDFKVEITVDDGVVWLAGRAASLGQKMRALKLAEEHPGVRYVIDQMKLAPANESAAVTVRVPDQTDVTYYLRRYLRRRMPALLNSTVEIVDHTIELTPNTERPMTPAEVGALEAMLRKIPELKAYTLQVKPRASVVNPR